MLGIVFLIFMLSVGMFWLYRTWQKISNKIEIREKLHQLEIKKIMIAEKEAEIEELSLKIVEMGKRGLDWKKHMGN